MIKDLQWVKKQLNRAIMGEEGFEDGYWTAVEKFNELVDKMEEPETLTQEWIIRNTSPADGEGRRYVWESDLENLIVDPNEDKIYIEKPEIPQFVADYLKRFEIVFPSSIR